MNRIFTIPNLLSLIRILLIPVFVALFFHDEMIWAALILIISGLTDTLDGYIARHYDYQSGQGLRSYRGQADTGRGRLLPMC